MEGGNLARLGPDACGVVTGWNVVHSDSSDSLIRPAVVLPAGREAAACAGDDDSSREGLAAVYNVFIIRADGHWADSVTFHNAAGPTQTTGGLLRKSCRHVGRSRGFEPPWKSNTGLA